MKSAIMGEMEALAQPLIQEASTAWVVGLPVTLSPKRAKDYARAIELMAQCIDAHTASQYADKRFRWAFYRVLALAGLLFAVVHFS